MILFANRDTIWVNFTKNHMAEKRDIGTMTLADQMSLRLQRLEFLEKRGFNPYPAEPPQRTASNSVIRDRASEFLDKNIPVHSVGRVTAIRNFGQLMFVRIDDGSGEGEQRGDIQLMLSFKTDPELLALFKGGTDIGDIIHVSGPLTTTKTGELTITTQNWGMLAKSLRPPPSLQWRDKKVDQETARAKRYLELMASQEARDRFRVRSQIVSIMRERFMQLGNLEVETPVLDTIYGGANAKPFTTYHNALDQAMYLRISNELYLKRLVVGMLSAGEGGVFEFSKDFRNEGMDATHHPEFMQVELYMPYRDYNFMMDMTETLYRNIVQKTKGNLRVEFQGHTIDFNNWRRLRIYDGLRNILEIDPRTVSDDVLQSLAEQYKVNPQQDRGYLLLDLFETVVLPRYGPDPIFVLDYPKSTSPLTKIHRTEPDLVERFELFVNGMEVANCYSELNDPRDQRSRFEAETKRKEEGDAEAQPEDGEFIEAMEYGLPPMGGIGLSIDRLTMLLTDQANIQDVILFPHRKKTK